MKKFYIPTLLAVFFLSSFYSKGQTYTSISPNPSNLTYDDPNFWIGHVVPPNPCTGCTIIIQSNVSMVQSGSSTANPNVTIFGVQVPANGPTTFPGGVTVGTKFLSSVDGYVNSMRFYKQSGMGGTHIGAIFSVTPSEALIAQVTYTNETASGWQTANFTSPVPITGGSTYIMATYASDGQFAWDNNYFDAAGSHPTGVTSGPLTALPDNGVFGSNGLYDGTGPGLQFPSTVPTTPFVSPNLWVDKKKKR